MEKLDVAAEGYEKITEGLEKGSEFLEKHKKKFAAFGGVFQKADKIIGKIAPWLGPIGVGLKIATSFVSLFVKKGMN